MSEVRAAQAAHDQSHTINQPDEWPAEVVVSFTRLRSDARIMPEALGDNPNEIDFAVTNRKYPHVPRFTACEAGSTEEGVPLVGDTAQAYFPANETDIEWIKSFWSDAGYQVEVLNDTASSFEMRGRSAWGNMIVGSSLFDRDIYDLRILSV